MWNFNITLKYSTEYIYLYRQLFKTCFTDDLAKLYIHLENAEFANASAIYMYFSPYISITCKHKWGSKYFSSALFA